MLERSDTMSESHTIVSLESEHTSIEEAEKKWDIIKERMVGAFLDLTKDIDRPYNSGEVLCANNKRYRIEINYHSISKKYSIDVILRDTVSLGELDIGQSEIFDAQNFLKWPTQLRIYDWYSGVDRP